MPINVPEWKLFVGDVPYVSTPGFHEHRERASHLEQPHHQPRLHVAAGFIRASARERSTFSDLGCGDGGLLSLVQDSFDRAWGYDFQPSNTAGWTGRRVTASLLDVFGADRDKAELGNVVAMTEVLEHLADPHEVLAWIYNHPGVETLVCSSPVNESAGAHDECHAWAWDASGYAAMVVNAGFGIVSQEIIDPFQVIRARRDRI